MPDSLSLRRNLETRARIIESVRSFFRVQGFLEVETPVRVSSPAPEANIDAFSSEGRYLSTSPEIHMKQLLADGYERIFQVARCFRRGEIGRLHNPEFTALEWYRTGTDYLGILGDIECLIEYICRYLGAWPVLSYQGSVIKMTSPWRRLKVAEAFERFAGWRPGANPNPDKFDMDMVDKVEPGINWGAPAVLMDYPIAMASLARARQDDPDVAERLEVYIGGLELANAYSELNDAAEQRRRFQEENERRVKAGKCCYPTPERFLSIIGRIPTAGGCALGLDRLVMLLCDASSIREVMAFTSDKA